jgi:hypothetical protein
VKKFLDVLKDRRDNAKQRMTAALRAAEAAEADWKLWDAAVKQEEQSQTSSAVDTLDDAPPDWKNINLTLANVRRKGDILKNALRASSKSMTTSELVKAVSPAVSRASVYSLVKKMIQTGEFMQDQNGRIHVPEGY